MAVLSVPKLVQSNSCPGASSLSRIIPNRDPPDLQSFSISRFPPDVDGRLHVQHRHVDADCRPELAGPEAFQLAVSAWPGRLSGGHPDFSVLARSEEHTSELQS